MFKTKAYFLACIVRTALICSPLPTQAASPYQSLNNNYGVSGGNVNDITNAFCCSGTLGSLVKNVTSTGTTYYILGNNHVLARQDQAVIGEDISQPGLIDNGCRRPRIVADFTKAVRLGNNVDCAIAALRPNTMVTTGYIQGIGIPNSTTVNPTVGMAVQKSGRTTGRTTGTIGSINTSVNVRYQLRCHQGKQYTLSYTHQVLINSSSFSAGGDSGSLIVTNNSNKNPVALLFAGSSTTTIANPIKEVLSKLSTAFGKAVTFGAISAATASVSTIDAQAFQLPEQALDHAGKILEQNRHDLMSKPGVLGVGLGALEDNSQAAVIVYVDETKSAKPQLPERVDDVPVRVIFTDPFIAF
jgi:hypothetical protein